MLLMGIFWALTEEQNIEQQICMTPFLKISTGQLINYILILFCLYCFQLLGVTIYYHYNALLMLLQLAKISGMYFIQRIILYRSSYYTVYHIRQYSILYDSLHYTILYTVHHSIQFIILYSAS